MMCKNIVLCNKTDEAKRSVWNKSTYGVFLYYICRNISDIICEVHQNRQYQHRYHPNRHLPLLCIHHQTPENLPDRLCFYNIRRFLWGNKPCGAYASIHPYNFVIICPSMTRTGFNARFEFTCVTHNIVNVFSFVYYFYPNG